MKWVLIWWFFGSPITPASSTASQMFDDRNACYAALSAVISQSKTQHEGKRAADGICVPQASG